MSYCLLGWAHHDDDKGAKMKMKMMMMRKMLRYLEELSVHVRIMMRIVQMMIT